MRRAVDSVYSRPSFRLPQARIRPAAVFARRTAAPAQTPRVPDRRRSPGAQDRRRRADLPRWKVVAYTVTQADFKQDAFVTHLWLADPPTGGRCQLTRGDEVGRQPALVARRPLAGVHQRPRRRQEPDLRHPPRRRRGRATDQGRDRRQRLRLVARRQDRSPSSPPSRTRTRRRPQGAPRRLRASSPGVRPRPPLDDRRGRGAARRRPPASSAPRGRRFSVGSFSWSPDGARIAFSATVNPDLIQGGTADLYVLTWPSDAVKKIVSQPGPDTNPRWSPDGNAARLPVRDGQAALLPRQLAHRRGPRRRRHAALDHRRLRREPGLIDWKRGRHLLLGAVRRPPSHLFRVDPDGRSDHARHRPGRPDGRRLLAHPRRPADSRSRAASPTSMAEVFVSRRRTVRAAQAHRHDRAAQPLIVGTPEVISWKSKDGTTIEGVLIKPADFDPAQKYPLLCRSTAARPASTGRCCSARATIPSDVWAGRGASCSRSTTAAAPATARSSAS